MVASAHRIPLDLASKRAFHQQNRGEVPAMSFGPKAGLPRNNYREALLIESHPAIIANLFNRFRSDVSIPLNIRTFLQGNMLFWRDKQYAIAILNPTAGNLEAVGNAMRVGLRVGCIAKRLANDSNHTDMTPALCKQFGVSLKKGKPVETTRSEDAKMKSETRNPMGAICSINGTNPIENSHIQAFSVVNVEKQTDNAYILYVSVVYDVQFAQAVWELLREDNEENIMGLGNATRHFVDHGVVDVLVHLPKEPLPSPAPHEYQHLLQEYLDAEPVDPNLHRSNRNLTIQPHIVAAYNIEFRFQQPGTTVGVYSLSFPPRWKINGMCVKHSGTPATSNRDGDSASFTGRTRSQRTHLLQLRTDFYKAGRAERLHMSTLRMFCSGTVRLCREACI